MIESYYVFGKKSTRTSDSLSVTRVMK
jgi:hypothetical protein